MRGVAICPIYFRHIYLMIRPFQLFIENDSIKIDQMCGRRCTIVVIGRRVEINVFCHLMCVGL